jgi:hypothetical protein
MVAFYTVKYTLRMAAFEVIVTNPMTKPEVTHRSYLLRLWREEEPGASWRAMLESVTEPGERQYFKDLESLAAFLLKHQVENAEGDEQH